ncbi:MAG: ribonuclease R [Candidatus Kinetoplastibacterium crithidii]|nr:MAG: ribonuclease R [Candidatus Kinetoplastibacterium crithidii]
MAKLEKNNIKLNESIPNWFDHDLPSREEIVDCIRKNNTKLNEIDIASLLQIKQKKTIISLKKRIAAMQKDEQIIIDKLGYISLNIDNIFLKGKIILKNDGTGILSTNYEKIFISHKEMRKVFHGDYVQVKKIKYNKTLNCSEGKIIEVLERSSKDIIGKIIKIKDDFYLIPIEPKYNNKIILLDKNLSDGQVVIINIIKQPTIYSLAVGNIKEYIGNINDPKIGTKVSLEKFHIRNSFNDKIYEELKTITNNTNYSNRVNLTNLPFITIDDEDARDFDDALFCKKIIDENGIISWKVFVAIADVSEYVKPDTEINQEALERGTSIYFPEYVVPMLPEQISNDICSLIPEEERLVLICQFIVSENILSDKDHIVKDYSFYQAIIKSKARMSYNIIDKFISYKEDNSNISNDVKININNLHETCKILSKASKLRGSIAFEILENKIIFAENGRIEKIVKKERSIANKIVEECMLAANSCAAHFIYINKNICLYRIHDKPSNNSVNNLTKFLISQKLQIGNYNFSTSQGINNFLDDIRDRNNFYIIQLACLQAMQPASYSIHNIGHFGLSYKLYTHFTSPIRRYPDLFNHRIIKKIINSNCENNLHGISSDELIKFGNDMSIRERYADDASRYANNWILLTFLKKYEGKFFNGTITNILNYGMFVNLEDIFIDGMLHISELKKEQFKYNKDANSFYNKESKISYKLGGKIRVLIKLVNIEQGQVVLGL